MTGMLPWNTPNNNRSIAEKPSAEILYDMEAAAIYQAGIHFFGPHQMIFLKIVSDRGIIEKVSKEQIALLMEKYQECIIDYMEQISTVTQKTNEHKKFLCQEEKEWQELRKHP